MEEGLQRKLRRTDSKAHCAVTVDYGDRPYQGIVEVDDTSLAASLEHYFQRSAQVPSHIVLVANEELPAVFCCNSFPGNPSRKTTGIDCISSPDTFRHEILKATELQLIGKLFAEDDVRVYQPRPVNFRCRCSARKIEDVLKMLGEEEARETLEEQGDIEVICEYCGRRRQYDTVDVERLFADNVISGPDSVQ